MPSHNTSGTLTVVGASHLVPGTISSLTTVVVVTVTLLPLAAVNVNWSCWPIFCLSVVII